MYERSATNIRDWSLAYPFKYPGVLIPGETGLCNDERNTAYGGAGQWCMQDEQLPNDLS